MTMKGTSDWYRFLPLLIYFLWMIFFKKKKSKINQAEEKNPWPEPTLDESSKQKAFLDKNISLPHNLVKSSLSTPKKKERVKSSIFLKKKDISKKKLSKNFVKKNIKNGIIFSEILKRPFEN